MFKNWMIASGIAMIGTSAMAQGQVAIYGIMGATVRHATNAGAPGKNALEDGAFYQSRLGFQGNEALGGGLNAIFTVEMGFDPSTGTIQPGPSTAAGTYSQSPSPAGRIFGRQSFVGLSGSLGTLTLGRQYTFAHTLSGRFQPQTNPNSPALSVFPQWHVARWDNMVKYEYTIGGLGLGVAVAANEGNGKSSTVGGSYKAASWELDAYYEQMQSNGVGADTRTVGGLGGTYSILPTLKGYLGYMKRAQRTSPVENNVVTSGLLFDATNQLQLTLSLTADRQSAVGTTPKGKRSVGFAEAEYRFSKRTSVYVEIDRNIVTGGYALPAFMLTKGQQTGGSIGLQHRF
jgi:predicted porin